MFVVSAKVNLLVIKVDNADIWPPCICPTILAVSQPVVSLTICTSVSASQFASLTTCSSVSHSLMRAYVFISIYQLVARLTMCSSVYLSPLRAWLRVHQYISACCEPYYMFISISQSVASLTTCSSVSHSLLRSLLCVRQCLLACCESYYVHVFTVSPNLLRAFPDSKVHGANMGPTAVLSAPDGPHIGPMNLAIRVTMCSSVSLSLLWGLLCIYQCFLVCFEP